MKELKNGGLAFPHEQWNSDDTKNIQGGMTLRDYFAAKAMQGLAVNRKENNLSTDEIAFEAYLIADSLLAEREK